MVKRNCKCRSCYGSAQPYASILRPIDYCSAVSSFALTRPAYRASTLRDIVKNRRRESEGEILSSINFLDF